MPSTKKHAGLPGIVSAFAIAAAVLLLPHSAQAQSDQSAPQPAAAQPSDPVAALLDDSSASSAQTDQAPAVVSRAPTDNSAAAAPSDMSPHALGMEGVPKTSAYYAHHMPAHKEAKTAVSGTPDSASPVPEHDSIWVTLDPSKKNRVLGTSDSDSAVGPTSATHWQAPYKALQAGRDENLQSTVNVSGGPTGFEESTRVLLDNIEGWGCIRNDNGHGPTCAGINADANGIGREAIFYLGSKTLMSKYAPYWRAVEHLPAPLRWTAYNYVVNRNPGTHELNLIDRAHGNLASLRQLIREDYRQLEIRQPWNKAIWDCRQMRVNEIAAGENLTACNGHPARHYPHRFHPVYASVDPTQVIDNQIADVAAQDSDGTAPVESEVRPFHLPHIPKAAKLAGILLMAAFAALAVAPKISRFARRVKSDIAKRKQDKRQCRTDAIREEYYRNLSQVTSLSAFRKAARHPAPVQAPVAAAGFVKENFDRAYATIAPVIDQMRKVAEKPAQTVRAFADDKAGKIRILSKEKADIEVLDEEKASYARALRTIARTSNVVLINRADDSQKQRIYETAREMFEAGELGNLFKIGDEVWRRKPGGPRQPESYPRTAQDAQLKAA